MSLTRRSLFVGTVTCPVLTCAEKKDSEESLKVPNNQCPVCGTVAPSYRSDTCVMSAEATAIAVGENAKLTYKEVPCNQSQIVRCKICNAAFWQDAEEVAK